MIHRICYRGFFIYKIRHSGKQISDIKGDKRMKNKEAKRLRYKPILIFTD